MNEKPRFRASFSLGCAVNFQKPVKFRLEVFNQRLLAVNLFKQLIITFSELKRNHSENFFRTPVAEIATPCVPHLVHIIFGAADNLFGVCRNIHAYRRHIGYFYSYVLLRGHYYDVNNPVLLSRF